MDKSKEKIKNWLYWFWLGLAIIVVYKVLDNFPIIMDSIGGFFSVISPFLTGVFIAYILYVPCKSIEGMYKKTKIRIFSRRARALSVITVYAIVVLILVVLINFILPVLIGSVVDLISNIQGYFENAINGYNDLPEDSWLKSAMVKDAIQSIQNIDIKQYLQLDKIWEYILSALSAVTSVFDVLVAFVVSVYVLIGRADILNFFKRLAGAIFKERTYKNMDKYFNNSNQIFFKFLASQFMDAVVVGILVTIAMSIMGVKYAPLLGFFIGLFNMIPYVGAIIAVGISAIITLITGGFSQAVWMLIVVIILQQIDANIIGPRIVSQSLKVSPLLVMFAISIGGAYFGILGMFLAVPISAIIKILVEDFIRYTNISRTVAKMEEKKLN